MNFANSSTFIIGILNYIYFLLELVVVLDFFSSQFPIIVFFRYPAKQSGPLDYMIINFFGWTHGYGTLDFYPQKRFVPY